MKRVNKYVVLILAIGIILSSCTISKKYSRPDLNLPQNFRDNIAVTADTVLLPLRTFFKDALLIDLIEKALKNNNEVAVALKNLQQLDLTYKQAKLSLLPTLDLNVGANRNWLSKNSLNGSLSEQFLGTSYMDNYDASLTLSWEADIWGKTKLQKESTLAEYFAQKENVSALKTRIITQVAQAYYDLLTLDEQILVANRNIALNDSTLRIIRLQYNSGQVNSLAVEQAEMQKKTAEILIPIAKQNIAVQENALSILCGAYPEGIERRKNDLMALSADVFPSGVPALLLSRRPDVKAAEYALIAANSRTGLAKVAMYPTISITPSIGANSFKFGTWFDLPGSLVKNIGANLLQPVFRKKSLKTAYEIAVLEQEKSGLQFKQSVLNAVGEVSDALVKLKYLDERALLVEQKNIYLAKATTDALLLYKSGAATYLEVIIAQNNTLQNELDIINIKREKLSVITDLYRALGGGI
jgi:NodT family efflux transporter outer membrane factor (OMF) lipoprotein